MPLEMLQLTLLFFFLFQSLVRLMIVSVSPQQIWQAKESAQPEGCGFTKLLWQRAGPKFKRAKPYLITLSLKKWFLFWINQMVDTNFSANPTKILQSILFWSFYLIVELTFYELNFLFVFFFVSRYILLDKFLDLIGVLALAN